jgi:histidinol-phosphate aminotransferase
MDKTFPALETLAPQYIQKFEAYIPSKPDAVLNEIFGCNRLWRLNNNENALGPSPCALQAIEAFHPFQASVYPSGDAYFLRQRLAEVTGLSLDSFIVGNGANEVIAFVIKAFCCEGDNIITADKTFAVYEWVAEFSGFEARLTPLRGYGFDPEAILAKMDGRTKKWLLAVSYWLLASIFILFMPFLETEYLNRTVDFQLLASSFRRGDGWP